VCNHDACSSPVGCVALLMKHNASGIPTFLLISSLIVMQLTLRTATRTFDVIPMSKVNTKCAKNAWLALAVLLYPV
jgi:hypothetical protein